MPHDIKAINSYSNNLGWIHLQYAHIAVVFASKKKIPMGKCNSYICMLQMNPPLFKVKGVESVCIIFQAGEVHFKVFYKLIHCIILKLKYVKKV